MMDYANRMEFLALALIYLAITVVIGIGYSNAIFIGGTVIDGEPLTEIQRSGLSFNIGLVDIGYAGIILLTFAVLMFTVIVPALSHYNLKFVIEEKDSDGRNDTRTTDPERED